MTTLNASATQTVHVRYFAGAAEAAGTGSQEVPVATGATAGELLDTIRALHGPQLSRVLEISSLLVDGVTREDLTTPLRADAEPVQVDVLPPFAGG